MREREREHGPKGAKAFAALQKVGFLENFHSHAVVYTAALCRMVGTGPHTSVSCLTKQQVKVTNCFLPLPF